MQYFGARSRAYDTDVIQLFKALADFTQPIELQKTLVNMKHIFTEETVQALLLKFLLGYWYWTLEVPWEHHVKLSEPDELRWVLTHRCTQGRPALRASHIDHVAEEKTHRDIQKGWVFSQQVDRAQRVDRHAYESETKPNHFNTKMLKNILNKYVRHQKWGIVTVWNFLLVSNDFKALR